MQGKFSIKTNKNSKEYCIHVKTADK